MIGAFFGMFGAKISPGAFSSTGHATLIDPLERCFFCVKHFYVCVRALTADQMNIEGGKVFLEKNNSCGTGLSL